MEHPEELQEAIEKEVSKSRSSSDTSGVESKSELSTASTIHKEEDTNVEQERAHHSAKYVASVANTTSWCRLWDLALDRRKNLPYIGQNLSILVKKTLSILVMYIVVYHVLSHVESYNGYV